MYFFKSTCFYCIVILRRNLRHLSQSYLQNLADRRESFLTQDFCMDKQKNSKWSIRIQLTGVNVVEMILQQFSNMNTNTWNLKVVFPEPISCFEVCQTSVQNKSRSFLYLFAALFVILITYHVQNCGRRALHVWNNVNSDRFWRLYVQFWISSSCTLFSVSTEIKTAIR